MLSSLSSFLPSALNHTSSSHSASDFQPEPEPKQSEEDEDKPDATNHRKKKDKDKKTVNETFIIVRPPPSKSNHPLNLQVQLVPPNTKAPGTASNRQSLDLSAPENLTTEATTFEQPQAADGIPLSRVSTNRSDVSAYSSSGYASTASFSSVSSSASNRRTIIPLYNLQAHNVMTNVIVDAGTDARVAKFLKRGIEVVDLAILEPVEVWGVKPTTLASSAPAPLPGSARASLDMTNFLRPTSSRNASRPTTPDIQSNHTPSSSTLSVASAGLPPTAVETTLAVNTTPVPPGKRNIFGKLFKRKPDASTIQAPALSTVPSSTSAIVTPKAPQQLAGNPMSSTPTQPAFDLTVEATTPTNSSMASSTNNNLSVTSPNVGAAGLRQPPAPVLGIQPMMSHIPNAPPGRATMYVWIVRKWIKGDEGGILAGMMRGSGFGGNTDEQKQHKVEVRFEWKRSQKTIKSKRRKDAPVSHNGSTVGLDENASQTSLRPDVRPDDRSPSKERKAKHRMSTVSVSTTAATSDGGHNNPEDDGGDGYDSDPEDSEVPWTCTLKIKRVPIPGAEPQSPSAPETIRIKVATLSPTPHHPKVVSMLKVPFPLADIEVDRMIVMRRTVGVPNLVPGTPGMGMVLTAEEIKDVVSCTALWLVVREGFGGVGKVSRKGDGWRIRA